MRICLFTPTFLPSVGGVELAVHHIASALSSAGHEVAVVTFRADRLRHSASQTYKVFSLPPGTARFRGRLAFLQELMIALRLAWLHKSWNFDLLNVHMAYPGGMAGYYLKRIVDVPVVVTCHAQDVQVYPELNYGLRLRPGLEPRIRKGIQHADVVTAVSDSIAANVLELCPTRTDLHVVPNGVSARRFGRKTADMRRRLGIDDSARVLLAVGRNHPKKGYANLVRAAALLAERHPLLRTVIVGDGTGPLASLAQELGIEDRVLLPGRLPSHTNAVPDPDSVPHDDLVSMYMESDVFVMPSYIEGMPLVIPEAMMAGLPVIATDVAGNRDIVEHGKTGLLISPGDIEGLANAVDCLLRDHALRIRLGETAKRVAWDYDWPVIAARYESVYESALRRPTARLQAARDY